jgi:hypothetical protein
VHFFRGKRALRQKAPHRRALRIAAPLIMKKTPRHPRKITVQGRPGKSFYACTQKHRLSFTKRLPRRHEAFPTLPAGSEKLYTFTGLQIL